MRKIVARIFLIAVLILIFGLTLLDDPSSVKLSTSTQEAVVQVVHNSSVEKISKIWTHSRILSFGYCGSTCVQEVLELSVLCRGIDT